MKHPDDETLDRTIEEALASEPWRPVPEDFHQRMAMRLHVAALLQMERRRARNGWAMAGLTLTGILMCLSVFAVMADIPGLIRYGMPGGMGYYDYVVTSISLRWADSGSSLGLAMTPILALGLLLAILPLRRRTTP
ncbi:MAG: hypothetical protein QG656_2718 [Candidatus Hydrogenedentes bacterium]|nr:hypothetical protein [Candidatus Hydrogenedentota bacterium]